MFLYARCDILSHFGSQPIVEAAGRVFPIAAHVKRGDSRAEAKGAEVSPVGEGEGGGGSELGVTFGPNHAAVSRRACEISRDKARLSEE